MATAFDGTNPALFDVPVPPQEFGQDGGKFYHYYDALADEIDDNMVTGLKEQLDGLLVFAGLFAGINTAFLAFTLPLMSPDPADDTNALLRDILLNLASGRNDSLPSLSSIPSDTFSPTGKILTVNVLFSISLTFALVSSFLAVLGRQWLVYYRKRTGGGPERQRWEQLKRFLGAERWRLEGVLDDVLPSLLQIGLIIFCISLTIYLNTLHPMLSNTVGVFMCAGLAFLIVTAIFAIWDKFCPFQSPLSHLIRTVGLLMITVPRAILWHLGRMAAKVHDYFFYQPQRRMGDGPPRDVHWLSEEGVKERLDKYLTTPMNSLFDYVKRKEEGDGTLQITAIRRAICTSDDARTLAHAVSNILSITDANLLMRLATDEEFDDRISALCSGSYNRILQLCGRDQTDLAAATSWLYRAATTHIYLSTVNPDQSSTPKQVTRRNEAIFDKPSLFPSSDLTINANPNMSIACLGFLVRFADRQTVQMPARRLGLRSTIDGLVNPSWKCISMLIEVIMVQWGIHGGYRRQVYAAWIGKPSTVHQNLNSLLERSNDSQCEDRDILREYLVDIFKLAGKAAANNGGDSSSRLAMAAGFLHFSEGLVRSKDSSSDLINAGRKLRAELISALQSECEKLSTQYWEDYVHPPEEMLDELIHLFTELAPEPDHDSAEEETVEIFGYQFSYMPLVRGRSVSTLCWDDEELVHVFSPILQQLSEIVMKGRVLLTTGLNTERKYLEFIRQVDTLEETFASLRVAVKPRQIKRLNRDPDLCWCYYSE